MKTAYTLIILMMLGFFAMANSVMANEIKPKTVTLTEIVEDVKNLPSNTQNFLTSEWEKTKAYQKEGWEDTKKMWPWKHFFKKESTND
tara:strand:- start:1139 stop:1402 length:264 start_codon:yes stop_codon:yes gene_type:complete